MEESYKKYIFKGAATALITPMNADRSIDFDSFGKLIDFQIKSGIDALVILGTTGEASTLSEYERQKCIDFAIEKIEGRVPTIIGTGTNDTAHTIQLSHFADKAGADALLVVTPYYNKTTAAGLIKHFMTIADSVSKPIILYNVPSRTGLNITLPVYREVAKHANIRAVKEASGNISQIAEIASELSEKIDIYSGNDDCTLPVLSLGGLGVISVLSNIIPGEVHELCDKYFKGDTSGAKKLQLRQMKLNEVLFSEVNPIPVKAACEILGLCKKNVRLPLCEMGDENRRRLYNVLTEYGLVN